MRYFKYPILFKIRYFNDLVKMERNKGSQYKISIFLHKNRTECEKSKNPLKELIRCVFCKDKLGTRKSIISRMGDTYTTRVGPYSKPIR